MVFRKKTIYWVRKKYRDKNTHQNSPVLFFSSNPDGYIYFQGLNSVQDKITTSLYRIDNDHLSYIIVFNDVVRHMIIFFLLLSFFLIIHDVVCIQLMTHPRFSVYLHCNTVLESIQSHMIDQMVCCV